MLLRKSARALAALLVLRASPSAGAEEGSSQAGLHSVDGTSSSSEELAEELEATMAKFDFDRDGSLNKKEALSWYRFLDEDIKEQDVIAQRDAAFLEFDHDRNSLISRTEVSDLLSCMDQVEADLGFTASSEEEGGEEGEEAEEEEGAEEGEAEEEGEEEDEEAEGEEEEGEEEGDEEGEEADGEESE
ncbi:unnamed protein product [Polarella glacialis]|uniref:EF-hand domain-containing protein n=2 Tax=Polarella glacialis TaxID=89957 RepID=A0A813JTV4_POLGL|nr:unnamed protein product [Polarella glacialis]